MGREINLLDALPTSKRNVKAREHAKTDEHIRISREYGETYFDGPREYGYGGYRYDGRWVPVARDMIAHFGLEPGMRVLDVGAAKGFLVKDFMIACPGLEAFGLDVSEYALKHCEPEAIGRLHLGSAVSLPFPDDSFDAVISLNTLHNLRKPDLITALQEIMRVARDGKAYVQVDSYRTEEARALFLDWVLTAYTHDYPEGWIRIFEEAGYTGDYNWTLIS
ncbi:methyltransferase domain-containing protein [Thalassobaculum sp. OXR-137]|uniref:class I SAM-dependent methyltransferase n=1 Tax=Thalassobaculum sp. OXR-137 TaxID=3100173 RepID=UPI002AC89769|nr:methyltransferase domain-containing protein [Thalassobaculum sp. OXR-137]WPZ36212.1 methyltransferase domain-containing protein [Thalassobaculum sp. OXR-137]